MKEKKRTFDLCAICFLLLALLFGFAPLPRAAAQDGFVTQIPMAACLEKLANRENVALLELGEGEYTLQLNRLRDGNARWLRMVVARDNYYYGACVLGNFDQLETLETLLVEAVFQQSRAEFIFTTAPDNLRRGAVTLPLALGGVPTLSPFATEQALVLQPRVAPEPTTTAAATQSTALPQAKKHIWPYVLALVALLAALAVFIAGRVFGYQRAAAFWTQAKGMIGKIRKNLPQRPIAVSSEQPKLGPAAKQSAHPEQDTLEMAAVSGVALTLELQQSSLLRRILMRDQPVVAAPSPQEEESAMRAYFRGRPGGRLPQYQFLTVGLRNRDALLRLDGEGAKALFAPNPKGQLFSLEEGSGNLYLHVEYFAPPSFVMQSVLSSVCLDKIFDCFDVNGNPLLPEDVLGRAIEDIAPARTVRTEAGFMVTEKGRLHIGSN
jgi:hypothetical protein